MPPPQVRTAIDAHRKGWYWRPGQKLAPIERLHMTLWFLGDEVSAAHEHAIRHELRSVRVPAPQIVLRVPDTWRNHVAVLMPQDSPDLRSLHSAIGEAIGAASDPQWQPHVTLARKALHARPPEAIEPIRWTVRDFALVHSVLGPQARYDIIERYPLA